MPGIGEPPTLLTRWAWLLDAYLDMEGDRQGAMGSVRPTPFATWDRMAERLSIEGEAYGDFRRLVRELDTEYMSFHAERAERAEREAKAKRGR